MAAALWVTKEVGVKKDTIGQKKETWWKRRFESDITNLRRDIRERDEEKLEGREKEKLRN